MTEPTTPHFRAFARRPINLPATVVAAGGSWERPGRLVDLGLGGACVSLLDAASSDALASGSRVEIVIDAPHLWEPLLLEGSVAWLREQADSPNAVLGVEFRHRTGSTLLTLTELLETTLYG